MRHGEQKISDSLASELERQAEPVKINILPLNEATTHKIRGNKNVYDRYTVLHF